MPSKGNDLNIFIVSINTTININSIQSNTLFKDHFFAIVPFSTDGFEFLFILIRDIIELFLFLAVFVHSICYWFLFLELLPLLVPLVNVKTITFMQFLKAT